MVTAGDRPESGEGVLAGRVVLDLSRLLPGPYCSMILADHGARVIAVEDRRFREEATPILNGVNRNKEHVSLNLKNPKGREIFLRLSKKADVVLEGFRPGVAERLGVGYEALRAVNPGIVYCSVTGYGQTGPWRDLVGHDVNYLGYSGVLSLVGELAGPPIIPGVQVADVAAGLHAAIGVLLALLHKDRTGQGQHVDISMTDCAMGLLPLAAGAYWATGKAPERGNSLLSHQYACYNVYRTADNHYVTLGALEPRFWQKACECLGVPQYGPLQFDDASQQEIGIFLWKKFLTKPRREWAAALAEAEICLGEVLDLEEALCSEAARARQMVCLADHPRRGTEPTLGVAAKLSSCPGSVRKAAPDFGEHTARVLGELGFSEGEIEQLATEQVT